MKIVSLWLTFFIYWGICYVVNFIQFIQCDFEAPYKEEVIHGLGVFLAVPSMITVWL